MEREIKEFLKDICKFIIVEMVDCVKWQSFSEVQYSGTHAKQ